MAFGPQGTMAPFLPGYLHLLMVGWITQLIFGVAYWLFPRPTAPDPRRDLLLGPTGLVLLNLGLVLRVAAEPRFGWGGREAALQASALSQFVAVSLLVLLIWPRVRPR